MSVPIPPGLTRTDRGPGWADWLDQLPGLVTELLDEWGLTVDGPATHGECALVVPVRTDGRAAVLKVSWPHWEAATEHVALQRWAGNGAVELFRADPHRFALLLERAGSTDLTPVPIDEACAVIGGLYNRLHVPAPGRLRSLSSQVIDWTDRLAGLPRDAPVPRRLVDRAVGIGRELAADPGTDGTLVHTDLHPGNVLAAEREPWLVIDPKPLSGDPAYEVAPMLWNRWDEALASGDVRSAVRRRLEMVVDAAGLDEDRARAWVQVRMMTNALWVVEEAQGPVPDSGHERIGVAVTVTKAVLD